MKKMDRNSRKTLTSDDKIGQNPDKNPTNWKPPDSLEQSVRWLDSDGVKLYEALNFIKASVTKGANEIARFRHLKGIDKLTEIIPNINPKFLGQILSILTTCCVEEKSCYKFAQCDGFKVFDDAVLKMLTTDSLRNRFCRLIAKLAARDSCRILIHDRPEIVKSIVGFLTEEATNECKLAVCKAIRVLSNSDSDQDAVLRWQALKAVAMLLKSDNDDVIMQSLGTVSQYLKRCTDECERQLISAETIQSLCTLSSRKEHPDIAKYSMSILLKIPSIRNLRPYLGFNNAVELFVRSAEAFMNSDMATMRTKDLRQLYHLVNSLCLCCRDPANRIKTKEVGGLGLLVRVLKTERLAHIHDRAISSLVCFNYYVEGLETLCNAEVFDMLVAHLYRCMRKVSGRPVGTGETIQSAVLDESSDLRSDKPCTSEAAEFDGLYEVEAFSPLNVEGCVGEMNLADDTAADMPTAAADEEVNAITEARDLEFGRENNLPRYSIHSPTYKAVISEMKFDDDAERNPRNMWEGIELYGNASSTRVSSPSGGSSPFRPCSTSSSSPRNSYSPMSLSSCSNFESTSEFGSPESELGLGENRGWSPCISGSDESGLSPLQDQADISLSTWSPISVNCDLIGRLDNSPSTQLSQEKRTSSNSISGLTCENDDLVQPCQSKSLNDNELVEQSDDDESLSMFNSESFRKQRHFAQMLERYEGAFQSCITPSVSEGQSNKGEKRKRSLSLETLTKIQKTVKGDIKRNTESCVGLDRLVSRTSSISGLSEKSSAPCRTRCVMSSERITMINILNLFWRALDLGNSNVALCRRKIVRAILDYIDHVNPPSRRASKLLLRLSQNLLSFEVLLKNGVPSLFHEALVLESCTGSLGAVHDADNKDDDISSAAGDGETNTDFCLQFNDDDCRNEPSTCEDSNINEGRVQAFAKQKVALYEHLICNLSIVAQTAFGEGIIIGMLKKGKQAERDQCMIELCYIAKSDAMKKQYLLKLGGLILLREMLSNPESCLFPRALRSVCYLANQLRIGSVSRNDLDSSYGGVGGVSGEVIPANDISFRMENGDLVFANRATMASSSEVFRALLEGHFAESTMSSIPILRVPTRAFQFLVRLIHNESLTDTVKSLSCENSTAVCEVLLEVLRLGNQYLMRDACEQVGKYICREFLTEDNAEEVFHLCVTLNCTTVVLHCLAYIFGGISSHMKIQQLVKKLLTGMWRREFLSAVASSLEDALSSS